MKLQERYSTLKKYYKDSLILIKSGLFYITYDEDAYLLNYYLITKLLIIKLVFPVLRLIQLKKN